MTSQGQGSMQVPAAGGKRRFEDVSYTPDYLVCSTGRSLKNKRHRRRLWPIDFHGNRPLLTKESPRAEVPKRYVSKKGLWPTQLATLHAMKTLESNPSHTDRVFVNTKMAVLGSAPGSGKTSTIAALFACQPPVRKAFSTYFPGNHFCLADKNRERYLHHCNVVFVPNGQLQFWNDTLTESIKKYNDVLDFSVLTLTNSISKQLAQRYSTGSTKAGDRDVRHFDIEVFQSCNVIVAGVSHVAEVVRVLRENNAIVARFVFDEIDSADVKGFNDGLPAVFTWLVCGTSEKFYVPGKQLKATNFITNSVVKDFISMLTEDVEKVSACTEKDTPINEYPTVFANSVVVELDPDFIEDVQSLPPPLTEVVCCESRLATALNGFVIPSAEKHIAAGNVGRLLRAYKISSPEATAHDLFRAISQRLERAAKTARVSYRIMRDTVGEDGAKNALELHRAAKARVEEFKLRVSEYDAGEASGEAGGLDKASKASKCIEIIRGAGGDAKILLFLGTVKEDARNHNPSAQKQGREIVMDFLKTEAIPHAVLDHNNTAEKMERFRQGKLRVLVMDAFKNGAGVNLQQATHIITYSGMSAQLKKQVVARAQRPGRDPTSVLRVYHLRHKDEIENGL